MEILRKLDPLPIDGVLPEIVAALRSNPSVVLRAPTGAGKTTRVPPALLDAGLLGERRVIVLEPRRVAARAAARRMAFERRCSLGEEVGYQVRFDRKWTDRTRILVVTEGTLVRMLQDDPFLDHVACVVFDEFHERSLDTDLSLGMVRRVQQTVRPDLKIAVMSATLGVEAVSRYLGDAPIVVSEGRLFPVEIRYEPRVDTIPLGLAVARSIERVISNGRESDPNRQRGQMLQNASESESTGASALSGASGYFDQHGDILVFLPGQREIREVAREVESLARDRDLLVMPLYGELPPEQQDAALQRQPRRKIVLATNVAETSVTVDGVTAVIDTGFSRQLRFDPTIGLDRLELLPISRASAEQRAGRAGRQQPGICIRLWNEASHRARPEQTTPEIQRVDLAGPVLQLKAWGESDVPAFPWFEPPRAESIAQADSVLRRLDAIDSQGNVTELGTRLAELPVHPRLGRLLIEGARLGQPERAALAAALLSERDPFAMQPGRPHHKHASESDVLDRVEALEEFERTGRETTSFGSIIRGTAQFIVQTKEQLLKFNRGTRDGSPLVDCKPTTDIDTRGLTPSVRREAADLAVLRALLAAFPDRLAKRREPRSPSGVMVGGRGVKLAPQSRVTQAELFLCLDVEGSGSEANVRVASAVDRSWLPEKMLNIGADVFFHEPSGRVQARRRVCWEDLILEESPAPLPEDDSVARMLAEAAVRHWEDVRPKDDSPAGRFLARVRCLSRWLPELNLAAFDDAELQALLPSLCLGRRSLAELKTAPWLETIQAMLTPTQWQAVEREAPTHLTVPSGSRIALEYEVGRPPILAVRIQEIFGLRETPRVARGRVPVLLHLLAPNYRPQQVTDDLPSFWANAYPIIRGELRRRYPRHPWPDDPLTAAAVRK